MDPDYALFARIVEAGSLSAAARALRLSPPMVSKRLARLEARLSVQLIRRTTRRLELTESGARFHADVVAILASIAEAEARLAGRASEPSGALRIAAPTSFARLHIAPLLPGFLAAFPRVELELDLSDGFVDLVAHRVDLAIRIAAAIDPSLTTERLASSRRVLCASPAYLAASGAPASVAKLADHRLLAAKGQLPWRLTGPGGAIIVEGESTVRTNSSELVTGMTLAGLGIALRSLWDVGGDLAAGRLVRVLPDHEGSADVGIFAVQPPSSLVPASVPAFVATLRAAFQPAPPWEAL